ncbi:MAG: hypothetical protein ACOYYS_10350 [Chloroflexota bacterium]
MVSVLNFLRIYEYPIYTIVGIFAAWQVWKFLQAWEELRAAAFGLEREKAQADLNVAAIWLLLCLLVAAGEFYVVSFVVPTIPEASPLPTATINPLATPTADLSGTPGSLSETATAISTLAPITSTGCVSDTVMISFPEDGAQVQGIITLEGTANAPDFGFYKYELARPGDAVWLSLNAGRQRVREGELGEWDTSAYPPDEYLLRLVVIDNEGNMLAPCVIRVRVLPTPEE